MGIEYLGNHKCRLVVYNGSDENGKPNRNVKTVTYINKKDAKNQYDTFKREIDEGEEPIGNAIRLSQLMDDVIASMERKGLKATTIRGYKIAKSRIKDTLGNPVAKEITPYMIDKWIAKLSEKYSPKTIRNTVSFLSTCFNKGMRWRVVVNNPCAGAELPAKETKEKITLELNDIQPFYSALKQEEDMDFIVAIELALFCGLRRSEIFGLTNKSVDLKNKTITINSTRHRIGNETIVQGTKTKSSERTLAIPDFIASDIRKLHKQHDEEIKKHKVISFSDYLILNGFGEPANPNNIYDWLKRFEEKNNLPLVSPHGLRHTYASMVNYFGRDVVEISNQLGHANKTITLDTYTHLFEDASHVSKEIASDVDDFVNGTFQIHTEIHTERIWKIWNILGI